MLFYNHLLFILDKDTLLCFLHTTAREVEDGSFHISVFRFQFFNACLLIGKSDNLATIAPRSLCLIFLNRTCRHMKGDIAIIRRPKSIIICRRHLLCIAVHVLQCTATRENITPYAFHTIANSHRGQTRATSETITPYELHTIANSNRGQTFATFESTTPYARHTIRYSHR